MQEYFIIALVSLVASLLTFFSGFGLGTILTPVFIAFLPPAEAIAATAIVHFLNNLFKLGLVGISKQKEILLKFGVPSMLASFAGAWLLLRISNIQTLYSYQLAGKTFEITAIKLCIGFMVIVFTLIELLPTFKNRSFDSKMLTVGGLISGFFGGLSGHQGALRSMFLIRTGLTKEEFIATGILIACMVDVARLGIYSQKLSEARLQGYAPMLIVAVLFAFLGAYLGNKFLKKMAFAVLQTLVSTMIILLGVLLALGII